MGRIGELVIIKFGGSVITDKSRPLSLNSGVLDSLSKTLSIHNSKKVIVHGGGSFGHYYAKLAGLNTKCKIVEDTNQVSLIRKSMLELNMHVINSLSLHGLNPYTITPFFWSKNLNNLKTLLYKLLSQNICPVFFGDVLPCTRGFKILSGDDISYLLCRLLKPSRMIFCIGVDGIFPSSNMDGPIIRELDYKVVRKVIAKQSFLDVTGGIARKIKIAYKISKLGVDVFFVNGFKPHDFLKALNGEYGVGTCMRGVR
ncbi:MAG: isopentenyl phosphate kinase [Nitrososphaeria archaeon]|nr:isopentenyl phosphate kinase [Nitrososphaeria archaeon]